MDDLQMEFDKTSAALGMDDGLLGITTTAGRNIYFVGMADCFSGLSLDACYFTFSGKYGASMELEINSREGVDVYSNKLVTGNVLYTGFLLPHKSFASTHRGKSHALIKGLSNLSAGSINDIRCDDLFLRRTHELVSLHFKSDVPFILEAVK